MARNSQRHSSRKSLTNYTPRSRNRLEVWIPAAGSERLTTVIKKAPFKVEEEGWGEFDLGVTLHLVEREGVKELKHDLNFQESRYESPHKLVRAPGSRVDQMLMVDI